MRKIVANLKRTGLNNFFFLLISVVFLAWLFPSYGTVNGPLPLSAITKYGVAIIFFFYGLGLSPEKLKAGLTNWKLHIIIQATTFILFPLFVLSFSFLLNDPEYKLMWLGTFYLAALPSTVSSSVVMVSIAGGNLSAAIFNASISSIIGIFVTPLWMSFFIDEMGSVAELSDIILNLCIQILLPVIAGILLHSFWGKFVEHHKKKLRFFDQSIILLIVYTAFCESLAGNMFQDHSLMEILALGGIMLLFFLFMFTIMYAL